MYSEAGRPAISLFIATYKHAFVTSFASLAMAMRMLPYHDTTQQLLLQA